MLGGRALRRESETLHRSGFNIDLRGRKEVPAARNENDQAEQEASCGSFETLGTGRRWALGVAWYGTDRRDGLLTIPGTGSKSQCGMTEDASSSVVVHLIWS